jgi:hypothetical protein
MRFKYFTNQSEGFEGTSIAINPDHIISILEKKVTIANDDGNREEKQTILFGGANGTWIVSEDMLTVVSRLNERD